MQKTVLGLAMLALIMIPQTASAYSKVNVNISNDGGDSTNNVKINSNSGSNEKHIVIESNGERKEYHGSDDSVHLESSNGTNQVTINGGDNKPNGTTKPAQTPSATAVPTATPTPSPTPTPSATDSATITINGEVLGESTQKEKDSLFEYMKRVFTSIFDKFF